MMHRAPAAPAMPPSVAKKIACQLTAPASGPVGLEKSSRSPPAAFRLSTMSGMTTAVRKYATPTQRKARMAPALGRPPPSSFCPSCSTGTYTPHDSTAPITNACQYSNFMGISATGSRTGKADRASLPPQRLQQRGAQRREHGGQAGAQAHGQDRQQQQGDAQPE